MDCHESHLIYTDTLITNFHVLQELYLLPNYLFTNYYTLHYKYEDLLALFIRSLMRKMLV